ncbi:pantetheine-phosphate adenylyltransferase [Heliomicrobium modesticaldum Ice1]|uniref:Phosphopantetheine adenylyltransferase n=1 Tax=Heliobacterium modesticaldum (strain ATCC 51547 / Ice1) TaxID=498761 RepID=COAD_HELMI|nr:pantetheine-phosphate adenylyltransferase [Heliomicrobium modesticaldum]B0TGU9.1 RecName: Full=Phosphopantetheine adenylyltransferase; AltName: Full=Dephospho-CoA pyrophosphorylase; AltName: Full=Pantetheine-phosphate adenylyltransferase; Short=PPAT [Heliomicrobium modesticaldum Ice1]ABZ84710.1 pantetheine-phosphate adenylyltransferase [Heliomicrobium modesticaldum Ice1]
MTVAVYPGSFDPITKGHMDIVERAAQIFHEVIVAVVINPNKKPLFTMDERVEMIRMAVSHISNVRVESFSGLLVDFTRKQGARAIVRGLRAVSDFEVEFQMALMNKRLYPEVETVFMATHTDYAFLSSSMVKEVASFGGDVSDYLPPAVLARMAEKYGDTVRGKAPVR